MNTNYPSAIKQMFFGKRGQCSNVPTDQEYDRLLEESVLAETVFLEKIKEFPEILALYKKFETVSNEWNLNSCFNHFSEGFRFGVLLGLDIAGLIKEE